MEISPLLAEIQKETVGQVHSHSSKFRVECRDAADRSGWGKSPSFSMLVSDVFSSAIFVIFYVQSVDDKKKY